MLVLARHSQHRYLQVRPCWPSYPESVHTGFNINDKQHVYDGKGPNLIEEVDNSVSCPPAPRTRSYDTCLV